MDRVLVVLDPEEPSRQLLREAADCTNGTDADLVLLSFISEEGFREDQETLQRIASAEHTSFKSETPLEAARGFATEMATSVLEANTEFETIGAIAEDSERADRIIEIAEKNDCDHIFLSGRRRSPTGKALFGDRTQSVLLTFDGFVTVAMA